MKAENIIKNYEELVLMTMNVDNIINRFAIWNDVVQERNYIHKFDECSENLDYNIKFKDGDIELYQMGVYWEELSVECVCIFPQSYLSMTKEELEVIALDKKAKLEIDLACQIKEREEKRKARQERREKILSSLKNNVKEMNVKFNDWKGDSAKYYKKKIVIHDNRIFLEEEGKELECAFIYSKQSEKIESYRNFSSNQTTNRYRLITKKLVNPIRNILLEVCLTKDEII